MTAILGDIGSRLWQYSWNDWGPIYPSMAWTTLVSIIVYHMALKTQEKQQLITLAIVHITKSWPRKNRSEYWTYLTFPHNVEIMSSVHSSSVLTVSSHLFNPSFIDNLNVSSGLVIYVTTDALQNTAMTL